MNIGKIIPTPIGIISGLQGEFINGDLVEAREVKVIGERCKANMKQLLFQKVEKPKILWKRETLLNRFGQFGRASDPHERKAVYVQESSILSAGEGLFARRNFKDEQLVSYFGGVKSFRNEFWARNRTEAETREDFTHLIGIADDDETGEELILSVPPGRRDPGEYCSTLGHKANHKFYRENVRYIRVDHPVWGDIVGLMAVRDISEDEEIFVNYGYHLQEGFDWGTAVLWYRRGYTNYIRRRLGLWSGKHFKQYMKQLGGY